MTVFEIETDEPPFPKEVCSHDKKNLAYYQRDTGAWLTVCEICGISGDDTSLPPGWKKKPSGAHTFDKAQLLEDMAIAAGTAQEPGYDCPKNCGGCSCHYRAPCSHCTDHFKGDS